MRNYQVFVNEHLIEFSSSSINIEIVDNFFQLFDPSKDELKLLVDYLFNESNVLHVQVSSQDIENSWNDFLAAFEQVVAAGGIVKNRMGNYLLIYRLGQWDLPKGKVESGEKNSEAAIREVQEECGLKHLSISRELPITYHMYKIEDKVVLKPTFWYAMDTEFVGELVPQYEEGIESVEWHELEDFKDKLSTSYASLQYLIKQADL